MLGEGIRSGHEWMHVWEVERLMIFDFALLTTKTKMENEAEMIMTACSCALI